MTVPCWSSVMVSQPQHRYIVPMAPGRSAKRSWIRQVMHEFSPAINGENVFFTACKHLVSWKASSGTNDMTQHHKKRHPRLRAEITKENSTTAEAKAKVSEAIALASDKRPSAAGSVSTTPGATGPTTSPAITRYLTPKLLAATRDAADRRYVLCCAINLRPQTMRLDEGYKLHVGALSPSYVETAMSAATFDSILSNVYTETCDEVKKGLRLHRESCMKLGYLGPFPGAQLDLTTVAKDEYITFSVSYIAESDTEITRVGLATRAFPGSHTASDIKPWIEKLTTEFFAGMMGDEVTPKDVFIAFTVDQGGNVVNSCIMLGIAVIKCNAHRLNSVTMWALGVSGSAKKCENPGMEKLMKRLAAVVGVFSHSVVNNDELKEIQKLQEDFSKIYELIRRNDTRWTTQHSMMARLLKLKKPIVEYFRRHSNNTRKLTSQEWKIANEVCSLLDVVAEVTIKIQGGADTHIGQSMFNMFEINNIFHETDHNIRTLDQPYDGGEVSKEQMTIDDLSGEAQLVRSVLLSKLAKKELGEARMLVERICALLDPRRKDCSAEHLINGSESLKNFTTTDVKNVTKTFVEPGVRQASPAAGGGGGGGESNPPAPKRQKGGSDLEERRRKRLAKAKASNASSSASPDTATRRSTIIERELRMYVAEETHPEEDDFSLLQFWLRMV